MSCTGNSGSWSRVTIGSSEREEANEETKNLILYYDCVKFFTNASRVLSGEVEGVVGNLMRLGIGIRKGLAIVGVSGEARVVRRRQRHSDAVLLVKHVRRVPAR